MADFYKNIDKVSAERLKDYLASKGNAVSGITYTLETDLAEEPVDLEFFREHCRVDFNTDDELLAKYLKAARESLERYAQLSFGERTVRLDAVKLTDDWRVMYGPIVEVLTDHNLFGQHIIRNSGGRYVTIRYKTGWPLGEVPEDIKIAICRYGAGLYAMREHLVLTIDGKVYEPRRMYDEAEKMINKWANPRFI